jgi:molybdenum cofactor cytidylyltransferase
MITAVVLAAGMSRRMGRPKLDLPWGDITVIEQVVSTVQEAGIDEVVVVTGASRQQVAQALGGYDVHLVHNPHFASTDMLESFQAGLHSLTTQVQAVLVCLGDQPQIQKEIVRLLIGAYTETKAGIVMPSYQRRRGHPWILDRRYWPEVLALGKGSSLRVFLKNHEEDIHYVLVNSRSILQDIDTPADYTLHKPD